MVVNSLTGQANDRNAVNALAIFSSEILELHISYLLQALPACRRSSEGEGITLAMFERRLIARTEA
jgi:hypothetical protein